MPWRRAGDLNPIACAIPVLQTGCGTCHLPAARAYTLRKAFWSSSAECAKPLWKNMLLSKIYGNEIAWALFSRESIADDDSDHGEQRAIMCGESACNVEKRIFLWKRRKTLILPPIAREMEGLAGVEPAT